MLDWAAHLEYLQSILLEYNLVKASIKPIMLRYFWKNSKLLILAELKYHDLELESFDQMVKKTINVKAKTTL